MPGVNIKKDDLVRVMAGKDRGKEGRVLRVNPRDGRVMVDGVAFVKKHQRPQTSRNTRAGQTGGIIDAEMFIDISNVQIVCGACGQPTRVGFIDVDGNKVRICRKCEREL